MAAPVCCVDQTRPGTKSIAGRWFCDEHYAKATYKRGGVWRSAAVAVAGLVIFVGLVFGLEAVFKPNLSGFTLVFAGLVLALVPAALWLFFFYQQDRLEPEPVGQVARMFLLGLAFAGAIGIPLTSQLLHVSDWLYRDTLTTWLGSIGLSGAVEAFLIYAVVRYFIFDSPEFDERTDGVVYATAAALGYATALNLQFILGSGGAALGTGELAVAEAALASAAFGGLLGYFLGRAKLEQEPVWWLSLGLLLTAALIGFFNILLGQVDPSTMSFGAAGAAVSLSTFSGLILAGALAVAVTAIVAWLINRDIARSLAGSQPTAVADPTVGDRQANFGVLGTFAVLLVVGLLGWNGAVNGSTAFNQGGVSGAYPAYYSDATGADEILRAADTLGTGAEFVITRTPLAAGAAAGDVAGELAAQRATDFDGYKVLETGAAAVAGHTGVTTQRFAYVDSNNLTNAVPELVEGLDYIFVDGGQATVVSMYTTPDDLDAVQPLFARFLNSLKF
jgi:RsiW-degrading membrane proteinase PrsW (M82 family)